MTELADHDQGDYTVGDPIADTKAPDRPDREALGHPPVRGEAGQPGQPPQAHGHRRRHRPGRRLGRRDAGRAGLPRRAVLLPGLAAPRALDRRAGRHQRRQELPQRRRLGLPALLRHGQGRRLPLARVQRLPARARSRVNIIDQCVAQGVPFAREYGGLLDNRSFGGVQVSRTFYARGQTGQQLLLGAYQALERQIAAGNVEMHARTEMLDLIVVDGRARGIVARDLVTGEIATAPRPTPSCSPPAATATSSTCRPTPRAPTPPRSGARTARAPLRQPLLHPDPPDLHPAHRRPPVEADADERVAAQRRPDLGAEGAGRRRDRRGEIPEDERDYYLERIVPELRQPGAPRHRLARGEERVRRGPRRRPRRARASTSTSPTPSSASARTAIEEQLRQPVRHVRADHRREPVRGADADLPGGPLHDGRPVGRLRPADARSPACSSIGEANFSDHGANRLGASRADAGPGRRLLRAAQHDQRLPRRTDRSTKVDRRPPGGRRGRGRRSTSASSSCWRSTATARSTRSTASSATSCGTTAAWRAPRRA